MASTRVMRAWLVALSVLSMLASNAQAQTASAVRKTLESSMLVTGQIQIAADGHVDGYTVDQQDKLPPEALQLLGQAIPQWTFEPIERQGVAVAARSNMQVQLVARKVGEAYEMSVRSADFSGDPQPGETVTSAVMDPPSYPMSAARAGASGIVFLLVEVGRDGKVQQVDAAQTNLTVVAGAHALNNFRGMFERSAVEAAKRWTFTPPTNGPSAQNASWIVRVPVDYSIGQRQKPGYGQWQTYVPGPRNPIPWVGAQMAADTSLEAGQGGQVSQLGYGPQLLTPLGAG